MVDPPLTKLPTQTAQKPGWKSWEEVPRDVDEVARHGPWFLEIFSGTARLTAAVRALGVPCLPPIDITVCQEVPSPFDVLDCDNWSFIMKLIACGAIKFLHFGTPCNSFSAARKEDGGPPPLRSEEFPEGFPDLEGLNLAIATLGNFFAERTVEAAEAVVRAGGDFSIENPRWSLLWCTIWIRRLMREARTFQVVFDQCAFGAASMKPTRILMSHQRLQAGLARKCPGNHVHEVLKGKVWSDQFGKVVFRTKLAQVYPHAMCSQMAFDIEALWSRPLEHFAPSFSLASNEDRKRPIGQQIVWKEHKQHNTALAAVASGYQLKRGALKPLLEIETSPGQAIQWLLDISHPFSVADPLHPSLQQAINAVASSAEGVLNNRQKLLSQWGSRAAVLLFDSDRLLVQIKDPFLRRLLRGVPDGAPPKMGTTCNVLLYKELSQAVQSQDQELPTLLLEGFPIVGPIARSHRWPSYQKDQTIVSLTELKAKAWDIRKKIISRIQGVPVSENLIKIWEATIEDVSEGSSVGPFETEQEVTKFLDQDDWIPTQRFEVVQKNKVRGCDSATTNLINQATEISEKLQLPSTDSNVAALRSLRSKCSDQEIAGWVLDERKAYRQVPIRPDHRKYSVIALKCPSSGKPVFFVMVGHSFGLVSAVYNYNRRSAFINEVLVSLFGLVAFSFYDDKYGFEPQSTIESAHLVAQSVHWWLGAHYDHKKLQLSRSPTILGVTYDLEKLVLLIKPSRKTELIEEIDQILTTGLLDPGSAGKLKGKLMFGASQLWGKLGRAFLRSISERQYARSSPDGFKLDHALSFSLRHWRKLISAGPPRPIEIRHAKNADVIIFTDGFTPDPRKNEKLADRVGGVIFDRRQMAPSQFTAVVPKHVQKKWIPRKTQIVPVEMVAPLIALETFKDRLFGADIILLIDSEAVEAALVKGYSSKEDLCELISVFWNQVFDLQARVFIDRVATDANPADWPSRNNLSFGEVAGWKSVQAVWPTALLSE